jgi:prolyl oligopeptidase
LPPAPELKPPATEAKPVTDTYHGVPVVDPYRWLEADEAPEVKAWTARQNEYTRRLLDRLPNRAAIRKRVSEVLSAKNPNYRTLDSVAGSWFVLFAEPPKQQPMLAVMPARAELNTMRVLVDPNQLDASGGTAIDWFVPSPDATRVAVSLSRNGTEWGDVRVLDVASGAWLPETITRVNGGTAGGDLAWLKDGSGFCYTRYPRPGERPAEDEPFFQQVYFHALGSAPESDRYELGKELPRIAEIQLAADPESGRILATVQRGDGGQFAHFLRDSSGRWKQLTDYPDQIVQVAFAPGKRLLAVSRREAPKGKLLVTDVSAPNFERARVLVPQSEHALISSFTEPTLAATAQRLYLSYQLGGPSEVRAFDWNGKAQPLPLPVQVAAVSEVRTDGPRALLYNLQSVIQAPAFYVFDESTGTSTKTALAETPPVLMHGYKVTPEVAISKDGTRVPFHVVMPEGTKLDGSHACVATGYGGYGLSIEPYFSAVDGLALEQGVLLVKTNLRGGGEFGEEWHRQGALTHKQNVFDDFAAVLQTLVERGYTRPERLGIVGGSNGGLLMGATLTQHPELVHAVVSFVGIYDSLRSELLPNGRFNVEEFGTVQDPQQFAALYAYSPYHHVQAHTAYPATFLLTGENDPRVGPMQTRKMAAQLQAANAGPTPILFLARGGTGHGLDTPLEIRIEERTDLMTFMFAQLGVAFRAPN